MAALRRDRFSRCSHCYKVQSLDEGFSVAILTVRNVPDEVHRALRVRARANGKSMEAEVREILQAAAVPPDRVKLGSLLADIGQEAQLTDKEWGAFDSLRDKSPARTIDFG